MGFIQYTGSKLLSLGIQVQCSLNWIPPAVWHRICDLNTSTVKPTECGQASRTFTHIEDIVSRKSTQNLFTNVSSWSNELSKPKLLE